MLTAVKYNTIFHITATILTQAHLSHCTQEWISNTVYRDLWVQVCPPPPHPQRKKYGGETLAFLWSPLAGCRNRRGNLTPSLESCAHETEWRLLKNKPNIIFPELQVKKSTRHYISCITDNTFLLAQQDCSMHIDNAHGQVTCQTKLTLASF